MEDRRRMMIFIDLNNVEYGMNAFRSEGMYLDYSHLVEALSEGYDLMDVKVYDSNPVPGNSELISLHQSLSNAGMDVILKDPAPLENNMDRSCTQKEVDTSLVADVISNAYEDRYDVALIVSGDRDMRPAGDCIKRIGKDVIYASFYGTMCGEFRDSENRVVLEDIFVLEAVDSPLPCDCRSVATFDVIREAVADES